MDLEQLTKHQIVLLTLLVSFVTSIATGIVTVSLVNQAPPEVQRTINQIVERTVEVATAPLPQEPAAVAAVTEKTVVVKEDDLAAESIAAVQKAVVRIVAAYDPSSLLARGVLVGPTTVLSDRAALSQKGKLEAILATGERVTVVMRPGSGAVAVLDAALPQSTGIAPLADVSKVKLGQTVIRIGGTGIDTVGVGVIAAAPHNGVIEASVASATAGSVLISLFGEVVGVMTSASAQQSSSHYSIPTTSP